MDKNEGKQTTDNNDPVIVAEDQVETEELNTTEQPVLPQKSGSKLSLLFSLLALSGTAYLYYQNWQTGVSGLSDISLKIQSLEDESKVLRTDLYNTQEDVRKLTTQVSNQLPEIAATVQQLKESRTSEPLDTIGFDNSANEKALLDISRQLSEQSKIINTLQSQIAVQVSTPVAKDALAVEPVNDVFRQNQMALQTLWATQVLLDTHRIPKAIATLQNYLDVAKLESPMNAAIMQLKQQLQQLDLPQVEQLKQQLDEIRMAVNALQLITKTNQQTSADSQSSWYDRFISVKKIDEDNGVQSSTELILLKTNINRNLYEAGLYLVLQDQQAWQLSLKESASQLKQHMPKQSELIETIQNLAQQKVSVELPDQIDVQSMIDQLKGMK